MDGFTTLLLSTTIGNDQHVKKDLNLSSPNMATHQKGLHWWYVFSVCFGKNRKIDD
jgi:hypothetical protein